MRLRRKSHVGRGMRIVSVKQVVGKGEEREEEGPWWDVSFGLQEGEGERRTYEAFWSDTAESHDLLVMAGSGGVVDVAPVAFLLSLSMLLTSIIVKPVRFVAQVSLSS